MFSISNITTFNSSSISTGIPIASYKTGYSTTSSFKLTSSSNINSKYSNKIEISETLKSLITNYGITNISIQDSFNSPCSATINCKINNNKYSELLSTFSNTNKINLFGTAFRTESISILEKSNFHKQQYEISINLESWFSKYLDRYVTVKSNEFIKSTIEGYKYINISSIASKIGVSLESCGKYYIDENVSENISLNLSSVISQGLSDTSKYANYATLSSINVNTWSSGGSSHSLNNDNIFDIQLNTNIKVKKLEVPITELKWLTDIETEEEDPSTYSEDPIGYEPPKFNYNPQLIEIIETPDDFSYNIPFLHHTVIKTFDMNFDISGDVKTHDISVYEGSTLVKKTIDTYGYMFSSNQISGLTTTGFELNPSVFWQKVSSITTIYNYSEEGYLISENTTGWRYARFKTESLDDNIVGLNEELQNANDPNTIADLTNTLNLYTFNKIPIWGIKSYLLKPMLGLYSDLGNGIEKYVIYDALNTKGEIIKKYIENISYVEPFYITQELEYFNSFNWMPNENPNEQPYTTGEYRNIQKNIKVLDSKSLINSSSKAEDRYRVSYIIQNFSDGSFRNFYTERYSEIVSGRPPQGLYKPTPYTLGSSGQLIYPSSPSTPNNPITPNTKIKCIYTTPYKSTDSISSSKFYNVSNYTLALNAANTELKINNTFNNRSFTINTFFDTSIKSGDTVYINWNDVNYNTRVSSVTHSISIIDADNIIGYSSINSSECDNDTYTTNTINLDPTDPNDPNNSNDPNNPNIWLPPLDPNKIIGGLLNFTGTNRGSF